MCSSDLSPTCRPLSPPCRTRAKNCRRTSSWHRNAGLSFHISLGLRVHFLDRFAIPNRNTHVAASSTARGRHRRPSCSHVTSVTAPDQASTTGLKEARRTTASLSAFYNGIVSAHRPRFPTVRAAALRKSESFLHTNARTHRLRTPKCASRFDRETNDRA